jgi:hypothetical protein
MQADSINQDDVQTGKAMKQAFGWLAAVAVAAAVGLATIGVPESDLSPQVPKTDANAQGGPRAVTSPEAPSAPTRGELDPALRSPDRGNDHHG